MKKILSLLSLAVLTVGLLGSCSKINERLDNLEKDVNGLKNEKIASIESQIAGITSSIADLGTIRSDISSLKQSAENNGIDIINLEEADRALKDRIDNLEDYLDVTLPKFAEKEWVEATFSTLEQYDSTCTAIAEINVKIGELDARTARDIQACADSMKTWVNEQLDAYYTAAGMDAKLAKMKSAVDSARAANKITDAKADSIARELAKTKTAVDTAMANIRKEYKAAIKSAIDSSEARLTKKIQNKINKANKGVEELAGRVSDLEAAVAALTVRVEALEGMIQSVVIVPAYSDGSVKVENDSLYIDCIVSPSSVVEELDTAGVSILINKVKTKAYSGVDTIKISEGDLFEKDDTKGTVSVRVSVAGKIPAADSTITVAVNVKKDKSDYTTEFVPVTLPVSVRLDKHSIVVPSPSSDKDTTLIATVNPSTKDVAWTSSNTNIATVDGSGKVTIKAGVCGKDTIVVKTVEGNATDTCFLTIIPDGFVDLGVVVDGKPLYWAEKNLGASNPEDYGDYFAWGETAPYYTTTGGWPATPAWKEGKTSGYTWVSYCGQSSFVEWSTPPYDATTKILKPEFDAATAANSSWRTPTSDEFKALAAGCVWIWTTDYNSTSKAGYIVYKAKSEEDKGKANMNGTWKKWDVSQSKYVTDGASEATGYTTSDTHIFFPAAGNGNNTLLYFAGSNGRYWSGSLYTANTDYAYALNFISNQVNPQTNNTRYSGFSVRPVTIESSDPKPVVPVTGVTLDKTELSLMEGNSETLKATVQPADATNQNVIWSSDNTGVATVGSTDGKVTAVAEGTATITAIVDGLYTATCTVTVKASSEPEYVVMKMGSDQSKELKWATMNLGAEKETDYGYYFAWGGTEGYVYSDSQWKSGKDGSVLSGGFSQDNAPHYESSAYTKYTSSDSRTVLEPGDDAATALLGSGWRMPTSQEFKDLYDACGGSYDKTTNPSGASASVGKGVYWCTNYDGVAGCLFCDGTNKLFFPAAGYCDGTSLVAAGSFGGYLSSSLYTGSTDFAFYLDFISGYVIPQDYDVRCYGFSVRPVKDVK